MPVKILVDDLRQRGFTATKSHSPSAQTRSVPPTMIAQPPFHLNATGNAAPFKLMDDPDTGTVTRKAGHLPGVNV